jgi:transposase-like protein
MSTEMKNTKSSGRRYSQEFKQQAVELLLAGNLSMSTQREKGESDRRGGTVQSSIRSLSVIVGIPCGLL